MKNDKWMNLIWQKKKKDCSNQSELNQFKLAAKETDLCVNGVKLEQSRKFFFFSNQTPGNDKAFPLWRQSKYTLRYS